MWDTSPGAPGSGYLWEMWSDDLPTQPSSSSVVLHWRCGAVLSRSIFCGHPPPPPKKKKKNAEMLRTPQWFNPQELLGSHIWALDFPCPKWPCRVRGGAIIWFVMKKAWASASVISEARYGVSEVFSITVFFECWLLFPEVMTQIWVAIQSGDHIHPKLN